MLLLGNNRWTDGEVLASLQTLDTYKFRYFPDNELKNTEKCMKEKKGVLEIPEFAR